MNSNSTRLSIPMIFSCRTVPAKQTPLPFNTNNYHQWNLVGHGAAPCLQDRPHFGSPHRRDSHPSGLVTTSSG